MCSRKIDYSKFEANFAYFAIVEKYISTTNRLIDIVNSNNRELSSLELAYLNTTTSSVEGEALVMQSMGIYEMTEKKIRSWRDQYTWTVGSGHMKVTQILMKAEIDFDNDMLRKRIEEIYIGLYSQERGARRQAELTKKYLAECNKGDRIPKQNWII